MGMVAAASAIASKAFFLFDILPGAGLIARAHSYIRVFAPSGTIARIGYFRLQNGTWRGKLTFILAPD